MKEEQFTTYKELYERILPALKTKRTEMKSLKMITINEKDIWVYFWENKWQNIKHLTLADMVDDILNTDSFVIYKGVKDR